MLDKIEQLYASGQRVFNIDDLRVIWREQDFNRLKSQVKYYVDRGKLSRIRRGVYALVVDYSSWELAGKLIVPSYISLETALLKHALIFQYSEKITSMALYSRQISIGNETFEYHKMRKPALYDRTGIVRENNYEIASPERAVGDWMYLGRLPGFDNTRPLDSDKLKKIAAIYGVKSLEKKIVNLAESL